MKLLLDQGLPKSSAELLRRIGIDAIHVGEFGFHAAEDAAILQLGREQGRVVVTLDADFHTLLALTTANSPSVVRIRIEGLRGEQLTELLRVVIAQCSTELNAGAVVVVQVDRIRVRYLPLSAK
jgi:predicted nuclease of predicted toxin-antitoxin system